ncbi:major facilitator superfamily domain-containing protein [Aspergillus stella-maris]|uniref:major facilitator superfamily domain-containing protein n=1 Tax=Aspergillus stella-maris TaxID=1810926 RepID=UPI003CCCD482
MDTKQSMSSIKDAPISDDAAVGTILTEYEYYRQLSASFTEERLDKLLRKVDYHVLPQLILVYLLAYIDRSNAGNVKLFGALEDLRMDGTQWNISLSIFFITYAAGGMPSNIMLKRVGPRFWLPTLLIACGTMIICAGLQSSFGGWSAFRVLLGFVEAGIYPGCSIILTTWYSPKELHTRMTVFYSAASIAGAFSGLLAYGIGHADYTWGYRGWRWIYIVEGLFSVVVGLVCFFWIYPSPLLVKGWLSEDEKEFLLLRQQFSAGGETGVKEKEAFSWGDIDKAFKSMHTYAIALIEFTVATVVYGISFVLPTIIQNLGYSNVRAQAMTAPPYVFACVVTFVSGIMADRYRKRALSIILPNTMAVIGFVIIIASVRYEHVPGVTYLGIFLMAGGLYPVSPAVMAWVALNMAGSMKRSAAMALMISISQLGGVLGSNIFLANEAPTYPTGFGICLAMLVLFGVIWPGVYYVILERINKRRAVIPVDQVLAEHTLEELAEMGDVSPLFRYAL